MRLREKTLRTPETCSPKQVKSPPQPSAIALFFPMVFIGKRLKNPDFGNKSRICWSLLAVPYCFSIYAWILSPTSQEFFFNRFTDEWIGPEYWQWWNQACSLEETTSTYKYVFRNFFRVFLVNSMKNDNLAFERSTHSLWVILQHASIKRY